MLDLDKSCLHEDLTDQQDEWTPVHEQNKVAANLSRLATTHGTCGFANNGRPVNCTSNMQPEVFESLGVMVSDLISVKFLSNTAYNDMNYIKWVGIR